MRNLSQEPAKNPAQPLSFGRPVVPSAGPQRRDPPSLQVAMGDEGQLPRQAVPGRDQCRTRLVDRLYRFAWASWIGWNMELFNR